MKYKAVLFDADGTLLDTIEGLMFSVNYSLSQFGYEGKDMNFVRLNTGHGIRHLLKESLPVGTTDDNLEEAVKYFKDHYEKTCAQGSDPFPGIYDMLNGLKEKGLKLGVASNKNDEGVKTLCDSFFKDYQMAVFGQSDTLRCKPHPDLIIACMQALGVSPEETLFVGDSPIDYQAATAAGCDCVMVTWGFKPKDFLLETTLPIAFIDKPAELLDIV